ncbi:hypothetical protein PYCC9005_002103 [Savitreella phatthalungensis]
MVEEKTVETAIDAVALLNAEVHHSAAHPQRWHYLKKWSIIAVYCLLQVYVSMTSTSYLSIEPLIQDRYGTSVQATTLGQSMFITGTAIGPLFLGPLSDYIGRKYVYVGSIAVYMLLNIGLARVRTFAGLVVLMALAGAAGSTALVNVAATIADLYGESEQASQALSYFAATSAIGPSLGSPLGELIGEHLGLDWLFWINVIFGGAFAFGMLFVPETLPSKVISAKEARLPLPRALAFCTLTTLRLMTTEPILIFAGLFNGFAYGLLFLYLDGVYPVFAVNYGLSTIVADWTYSNVIVGVVLVCAFVPVQTRLYRRNPRPESRLLTSLVFVWGFPISLFWFGYTSEGVNVWSPIVAGTLLSFSNPLLYLSLLAYISDAYPDVANSAVAAFLIPSFLVAAGCAHVGIVMFNDLTTTHAFLILACVSFGIVLLTYVMFFFGPALRSKSPFAK